MIDSTLDIEQAGNLGLGGHKAQPHGVGASCGQLEVDAGAQKLVGDLNEDARAVTSVRLCALCAAMIQVAQRVEGRFDDVATGSTFDVGDEGDAASIVFEARVVQAIAFRQTTEWGS